MPDDDGHDGGRHWDHVIDRTEAEVVQPIAKAQVVQCQRQQGQHEANRGRSVRTRTPRRVGRRVLRLSAHNGVEKTCTPTPLFPPPSSHPQSDPFVLGAEGGSVSARLERVPRPERLAASTQVRTMVRLGAVLSIGTTLYVGTTRSVMPPVDPQPVGCVDMCLLALSLRSREWRLIDSLTVERVNA